MYTQYFTHGFFRGMGKISLVCIISLARKKGKKYNKNQSFLLTIAEMVLTMAIMPDIVEGWGEIVCAPHASG